MPNNYLGLGFARQDAREKLEIDYILGVRYYGPGLYKALIKCSNYALNREVKRIFKKSQKQVPVNTGALKNSAKIIRQKLRRGTFGGGLITGFFIRYGGPSKTDSGSRVNVDYAGHVHNTNRNYRRRGSKWRFLSDPLNESLRTGHRRYTRDFQRCFARQNLGHGERLQF